MPASLPSPPIGTIRRESEGGGESSGAASSSPSPSLIKLFLIDYLRNRRNEIFFIFLIMVPNPVHESFPGAAFEAAALLSYCLSPGRTTMNVSRIVAFSIWTLPTPSLCDSDRDRRRRRRLSPDSIENGAAATSHSVHQREATKTLNYSFFFFLFISFSL